MSEMNLQTYKLYSITRNIS